MVSTPSGKAKAAIGKAFASCSHFAAHCFNVAVASANAFGEWPEASGMADGVLVYGVSNQGFGHVGIIVKEGASFRFIHCAGAGKAVTKHDTDYMKYVFPNGHTLHTKS